MRNKTAICRVNSIGCGYCTCSWCTSCCYISFTFGFCGVFFITNTWLDRRNNNCRFSAVSLEDFCCLCWSQVTCTCIDLVAGCLLNNVIAFFEVFNLIFGWDLDHCRSRRDGNRLAFMRNEATICRINSIGCSYCTCPWSTSCCYISFTFGFCGVSFITNTWLDRRNNNCRFSAVSLEDFCCLCWSQVTCTCIDLVAGCLLNNVVAVFEVFNLILSWHLDHCRFWWDYHCWFFMRNEATICRINSIGCGYCSSAWSTSCCYISFTFGSCSVFFITNTWLKWYNHIFRFGTFWIGNVFPYCWSKSTCTGIDRISGCLLNNIIAFFEVFNLIFGWNFDHRRS